MSMEIPGNIPASLFATFQLLMLIFSKKIKLFFQQPIHTCSQIPKLLFGKLAIRADLPEGFSLVFPQRQRCGQNRKALQHRVMPNPPDQVRCLQAFSKL